MFDAQQLITENLDIWSSAIKTRSTAGRGSRNKLELYGIKKLRDLILDLAVRGLLVPQDSNDEPASYLLKKISKAQNELIHAKGIRTPKKKNLIVKEEEVVIEIPDGWEAVRNSELFFLRKGKMPKNLSDVDIGEPYLDIEALDRNNILRYTDDKKCPLSTDDDILVVCDGSRSGLVLNGKKGVVGSTLAVIETPKFIQGYVKLIFQQAFQRLNTSMKGAAIPHLDTKNLLIDIVGLPPLAEQHRIVAKVDELMALCDQLEQQQSNSLSAHQTLVQTLLGALTAASEREGFTAAWSRIAAHFHTLFTTESSIDQLKQTILQLAVMGKLIPQEPNDEPASALLEKIAKEKAKLIKTGKIKKQKTLPEIGEDEKPFELPEGWEWARFGELGLILGGGTPNKANPEYWSGDIPWVSPKDMKVSHIRSTQDYITHAAIENSSVKLIPENSLLVVVRGMILAHSFPVAINTVPVTVNQDMKALLVLKDITEYLLVMIQGLKRDFVSMVDRSSHGTCKLISEKLWNKQIAIPPLEEQHRIVTKVDELMTLCDTLKALLNAAQTTQLQLADSLAEQAAT